MRSTNDYCMKQFIDLLNNATRLYLSSLEIKLPDHFTNKQISLRKDSSSVINMSNPYENFLLFSSMNVR